MRRARGKIILISFIPRKEPTGTALFWRKLPKGTLESSVKHRSNLESAKGTNSESVLITANCLNAAQFEGLWTDLCGASRYNRLP